MEKKRRKARGLYSSCIILLSKVSIALFLVQKIALEVLARAEGNILSVGQERDIASLTLIFWLVFRFLPVCQAFTGIHSSSSLGIRGFFFSLDEELRRPQANRRRGSVFLRLDRNRKPRMKSLWHPGYSCRRHFSKKPVILKISAGA